MADFLKCFTAGLGSKFATKHQSQFPPVAIIHL